MRDHNGRKKLSVLHAIDNLSNIKRNIMLMLGMFTSVAFADDVDITVVPDKTSYEANETITLNVTVKNNTTMVMKNLSISNIVPGGLN